MANFPRLSPYTPYCFHCGRFVYVDTHRCTLDTDETRLMSRLRRLARDWDVRLRYADSLWVASSPDGVWDGQATGQTPEEAWANLEGVEPAVIRSRIDQCGVDGLPERAITLSDIDP